MRAVLPLEACFPVAPNGFNSSLVSAGMLASLIMPCLLGVHKTCTRPLLSLRQSHPSVRCFSTSEDASPKPITQLDSRLYPYLLAHTREPKVLQRLRAETVKQVPRGAHMLISPEQGQFMAWLVETLGATRIIELGIFTGYSALAMALAIPASGTLVACEKDPAPLELAKRYWKEAEVDSKIDLRVGAALDSLHALLEEGHADSFDFAFVDANKRQYWEYYELLLQLVRPGGVIAVDNVLFYGRVADPEEISKATVAIREFNDRIMDDDRITLSIAPIGDGIALCTRRAVPQAKAGL
ncbi:hypothetical protein WJX72_005422 [[Myrmecia] bisecta]|uniref:Caffeoyl-CoA O-methyltransferase n=1 Tax=[Myrmecia] bisecta TaxID=41462 RepID=A0AAW1PK89_9CHLO